MTHLETHWPFLSVLSIASAALACGGDDDPAGGSGGTSGSNGACVEDALFEPRSYGNDGTDLIRRMVIDPENGDLYFSVWQELYRLPAGSNAPELVMARPADAKPISGTFWLVGDQLLMPAAPGVGSIVTAATPGAMMDLVPVLYQAPRSGGAATLQVSSLMPSEEQVFYQISGARVVGDEVFWVDIRREREDFSTASPIADVYRAWRTNWRTPSEPELLYTSELDLEVPVVVNGVAYIDEAISESRGDGSRQRIIHLADGSVDPRGAEEIYGGRVIAGDDQSLIVYDDVIDLEAIDYGVHRVTLDGSQKERLFQGFTLHEWRGSGGAWAYDDYNVTANTRDIYFYQPGSAPRLLGCVPDGTYSLHDVVLGADAVYVAVFSRDFEATILRYPL